MFSETNQAINEIYNCREVQPPLIYLFTMFNFTMCIPEVKFMDKFLQLRASMLYHVCLRRAIWLQNSQPIFHLKRKEKKLNKVVEFVSTDRKKLSVNYFVCM